MQSDMPIPLFNMYFVAKHQLREVLRGGGYKDKQDGSWSKDDQFS